jgi:hypothetical protein
MREKDIIDLGYKPSHKSSDRSVDQSSMRNPSVRYSWRMPQKRLKTVRNFLHVELPDQENTLLKTRKTRLYLLA